MISCELGAAASRSRSSSGVRTGFEPARRARRPRRARRSSASVRQSATRAPGAPVDRAGAEQPLAGRAQLLAQHVDRARRAISVGDDGLRVARRARPVASVRRAAGADRRSAPRRRSSAPVAAKREPARCPCGFPARGVAHVRPPGGACTDPATGACADRHIDDRIRSRTMSTPDPPFTDEHEELRESVRGFIERELAPHAQQWEEERWFPDEVFAKMAAQGLLGLKYPEEYGGQGGDYLHEAVLCEEMARVGSGGTAAGLGAHINIATPPIWKFGTEEQKQRYLVPAIARRADRRARHHRARRRLGRGRASPPAPSAWTAAGWSTARRPTSPTACAPHFIVTAVKTTPRGRPPRHLLPDRRPRRGRRAPRSSQKLGWHASDTATIAFQDVFVPEENLLGELQRGLQADHGQLPVGAPGDGARRGRRDAARVGAHGRSSRASATPSAARCPATRRSATSSPTSPPPCTPAAASPTTRCAASSPARSR